MTRAPVERYCYTPVVLQVSFSNVLSCSKFTDYLGLAELYQSYFLAIIYYTYSIRLHSTWRSTSYTDEGSQHNYDEQYS